MSNPRMDAAAQRKRLVEAMPAGSSRLVALERLVNAIEDELSDDELGDEEKLMNIGERVASAQDGR